jgi:preprotein translocase subunit SecF
VHSKIHYDFIKNRNLFFIGSILITLVGLVMLVIATISPNVDFLHYGVDFKAGTTIDLTIGKTVEKAEVEKLFQDAGHSPSVLTIGGNNDRVSARFDETLNDDSVKQITGAFTQAYGSGVSTEISAVSPDMATEMGRKAIMAVAIASLCICLYVTIRFEWRFAVSAIITILYDAFFVLSIFSIFRFEVDLPFVAAVLTTIGYSINDKIVILDRIRENMRFAKIKTEEDLADVVNHSIWQTMGRSINTVVTVLFAAVSLFIFGSEAIKLFALAKIFGLVSGVYSSICLATPLWYLLRKRKIHVPQKPVLTTNP